MVWPVLCGIDVEQPCTLRRGNRLHVQDYARWPALRNIELSNIKKDNYMLERPSESKCVEIVVDAHVILEVME